ncbi:MAG: leucine-rich repeat domain-containing protein, partial [Clostridiales bacterium]|nr:leucine-rich repeat domain-containing protein [Clostridiales bacterium]
IGDNVFAAREKITAIVIPDSVTEIGEKSFFNCAGLTELTLPENLISIGNSAFGGCDGLKTVKIPDGVKHIGNSAFSGCIRLATVELPDDLEIIDDFAFAQCYALTELDCPDSLKSIGGEAFKMSGLVRVRFNIGLESVGYSAFYLCDRLIEVQNFDISIAPEGARYQIGLHNEIRYFDEEETSEIVTTDDGYMFYKGDITFNSLYSDVHSVLVAYKGNETALRLPDDFEDKPYSVYGNAFCRNVDLTSVNIPSTVKLIGRRAFYDCDNLTNVEIAAEKLDYETFFGCEKLKTATIDKNCRDFGYNAMIGIREIRYTGSVNDWLNVKIECSYSAPFSERCLLYIDGQPL